ncbi:hypothetical protein StoSoilA2_41170 [Arthrobacter sp. StoSoilA2]|nr:hypothetical protein StoSoilA2_41170 [Arthrobacter sp. StoSoilA2]
MDTSLSPQASRGPTAWFGQEQNCWFGPRVAGPEGASAGWAASRFGLSSVGKPGGYKIQYQERRFESKTFMQV